MKKQKMQTVRAWAHVTPTNMLVQFFRTNVYATKAEAKRALGAMNKYGFRIARVEIREIISAKKAAK